MSYCEGRFGKSKVGRCLKASPRKDFLSNLSFFGLLCGRKVVSWLWEFNSFGNADTHIPIQESFRPLWRIRTNQYAKVLVKLFQKRRLSLAKGNQTARSLWRRSQAAKYSLRPFFLQSFFFGLLPQRKSVKRFSGSNPSLKNVQLGCRGGVGHFIEFFCV